MKEPLIITSVEEWRAVCFCVYDLSRCHFLAVNICKLAERMGCSQQYVSRILKGKENLSLETIAKIEEALQMQIFTHHRRYIIKDDSQTSMVAEEEPAYH